MLSRFNGQYDFWMHLRHLSVSLAIYLLAFLFGAAPPAAEQTQATRIVAVGDVHGAYEPFVEILQTAGLIDSERKWTGGKATLVQTGDVFDRGEGVRDALDLLMRLEDEAKRAGGSVEALLGNHEVMNIYGDFRDVSPAVFAAFADARSDDRRQRAYEDYARLAIMLNDVRGWAKGTLPTYQDRKEFFESIVNGEPDPVELLRRGDEGAVRELIAAAQRDRATVGA